jgi:hypothetical protein
VSDSSRPSTKQRDLKVFGGTAVLTVGVVTFLTVNPSIPNHSQILFNDLLIVLGFFIALILINKSMYRQKTGSPKTKKATRWVNIKPYVMEMLKTHLNGKTEGLVFQTKRKTPLSNCVVLNKHLHPLLRKVGLERGGMHGFRHHRVSTLVMAGTAVGVIKKWIGHGSEEMVNRYTHLRPDFMQSELERVPDFAPKLSTKIAEFDRIDPQAVVAA